MMSKNQESEIRKRIAHLLAVHDGYESTAAYKKENGTIPEYFTETTDAIYRLISELSERKPLYRLCLEDGTTHTLNRGER